MIRVEFLGPLSTQAPLELEVKDMRELREVLAQKPELSKWLQICAVAVNDEIIKDENFALKSGDKILILPPVCGG
ncbi:MoaD/ThiS family protein [Helicobacter equorum]|uniref:Molybdopterin synthase sulfur carrier subunit n=1 Tax=Helicobacter equorum TaxID=361872 RepID=A0A3D8IRZ2_9HELI|nr:MoaD/ThiS family protein [Helicobacter equorum]MBR2112567.1 MoaD/ThiS family protein [Helicobacter sp.]MCI6312989.1 MoaD/ThiS family protein [Helicobacter sp.]MDD7346697.1 MoaD/ThiS family protein [Helicobacter sp.]MDY2823968.1 MoaD/ThiS family protein [Helicobacter sp.]RDU67364.1 molybdopterin synthase sulfur carrier subunit [Helicobacter equorum]